MTNDADRITLRADSVEATLAPADGGRLASLRIDGLEVLVTEGWGPMAWGAYPMAPWAGRLRDGVLHWRGADHAFPTHLAPPHAIHGTLLEAPWAVKSLGGQDVDLVAPLDEPWPFGGSVGHRIRLFADRLEARLEVRSEHGAFPAIVGWHPWFARTLRDASGDAHGGPVLLDLPARAMLRRGPDGLPDGTLVRPIPPGPWDDCFTELHGSPVVEWPGALRIAVESDALYLVVYTEREEGICVEPQTGPPNGLETGECAIVEPGQPLVASMTLRWSRPA